MNGLKKMSEINKQKWARMRMILGKFEEQPMTFEQIHTLVFRGSATHIGKRTTQNYLAELRALGLVHYDDHTQLYELARNNKQVYETRYDYEIALKHAKHLVLSTRHNQRFDQMSPNAALDLLVFESERDIDDQCFVQHLQTGYVRDVYALMEKYKKLMDETGLSKIPSIPKFGFSGSTWSEQSHMAAVQENISERDFEKKALLEETQVKGDKLMIEVSPFYSTRFITRQPEYVYIAKEKIREIIDLRDLLVGRTYSIVNDVINGIPLKGSCNHCPTLKVSIGK
jgi:hypothetical protein